MDAKQYILDKFNREYPTKLHGAMTLKAVLSDPRLKIELLPPPPRFEVHRETASRWRVFDVLVSPCLVVAEFIDQARAVDYAKWQNSLETE